MRSRFVAEAALAVLLLHASSWSSLLAQPSQGSVSSPAQRLAGRALGPTPLLDDLRELCDRIGGRPTGSSALERAVDWSAAKFRSAGIESLSEEAYTLPNIWLAESAQGARPPPGPFSLPLAASPSSPSTPPP